MGFLLVDYRVHLNGGFARAAVADDKLTLPAADGDHRVYRLDACLEGLFHRLAKYDAVCLLLDGTGLLSNHRPLIVQRLAQRADNPSDDSFAHRNLQHATGTLHRIAFLHQRCVAQQHHADAFFLQVECHPHHVVGEFEHLVIHAVLQAEDARDAVAHLEHNAPVLHLELLLVGGYLLFQNISYLFRTNLVH